jgi:2-polyprenyl-6-methoxyphenol hydroxylase-like FAD-dependent oxidoreductase
VFTRGRAPKPRAHALVVGAGVSGLLSARVLSESFERVTIVERDALPNGAVARKGVPQARHLHSLAARGSEILEDLFPGFDAELAAAGCPLLDQAADAVTVLSAGRLPRFRSGITMRAASRALVERRIRARLEEDPRTTFLPGREVVGLLPGPGGVSGVLTRLRGDGSAEELSADLVVDASGAGSRAPRWLEEMGYEAPKETVVDARLGYATRWYKVPEGFSGDWTGVAVLPGWPETTRGGTLRRVEGDLWTAVLIGTGGDYPPTDPEEFVAFAASLHSPAIHEAIKDAEPASPVYGYRRTANRLRHYERIRLPGNFLVAGDAACVLNPSYGQGMTAAALSAAALRESLSGDLTALSRRFQRRQRRAVAPCWTATTNSDAQWVAGGVGDLGPARRVLYRVSEEVMKLAVEREDVARTLLGVKNLIEPPAALLRPGILLPALAGTVKNRRAKPRRSATAEDKLITES